MTAKDKQLREAMDLLQADRKLLEGVAVEFDKRELPAAASVCRGYANNITDFQKRWSKSQKQPQ